MATSLAAQWAALEEHFQRHAKLVARFRETGRDAVVAMWKNQINEDGTPLSEFEREAPCRTVLRAIWDLAGLRTARRRRRQGAHAR